MDDKIPVLRLLDDGSNWATYRDRMVSVVAARGLKDHLVSTSVSEDYAVGSIGDISPETLRWYDDENVVKEMIATSVPNHVFKRARIILEDKGGTAKEFWDAVKKLHEERTLLLVELWRRLQTMRCDEEGGVREHFQYLTDLREMLAEMGKSMPDDSFALVLMGSLPPSYHPTLCTIAAATELCEVDATPAVVTKVAFGEYDRRTIQRGRTQEEAFSTDAQKTKRDIECENCHKRGHTKAECRAKGGDKKGNGPKKRDGQNLGEGEAAADQPALVEVWTVFELEDKGDLPPVPVTVAAEQADRPRVEVYVTSPSQHMSPYRAQFITYNKIRPRPFAGFNVSVFYAIGVGNMYIDIPNGAVWTKVLLRDVLYAPDLRGTIVSAPRFAQDGCSVEFGVTM